MSRTYVVPPHNELDLVVDHATVRLRIKAARAKQRRRIEKVAAECGIAVSTMADFERDVDKSFMFGHLLRVLDNLGLALLITEKDKAVEMLLNHDE